MILLFWNIYSSRFFFYTESSFNMYFVILIESITIPGTE